MLTAVFIHTPHTNTQSTHMHERSACTLTQMTYIHTHLCNLAQIFTHYIESNYTFIGLVLCL